MSTQTSPRFARVESGFYPTIVAVFVALLLISNIGAVKLIAFGPLITDGGAFLFPLVYVVGDVLAEVYGWKAARRAIIIAFVMGALAAVTFYLVQISPPADGWENQEAFEAVLGFVPRIVLASVLGFLVGQLLNAYVLVWIKRKTQERRLWARLMGSTVVGEFADTMVFELANGYSGYLPTEEQHRWGGYETWTGSAWFQADTSVKITKALSEMIASLARR